MSRIHYTKNGKIPSCGNSSRPTTSNTVKDDDDDDDDGGGGVRKSDTIMT